MSFDNEHNEKFQYEVIANMVDHVQSLNKLQLLKHCNDKVRPSLFIWEIFGLAINTKNMG